MLFGGVVKLVIHARLKISWAETCPCRFDPDHRYHMRAVDLIKEVKDSNAHYRFGHSVNVKMTVLALARFLVANGVKDEFGLNNKKLSPEIYLSVSLNSHEILIHMVTTGQLDKIEIRDGFGTSIRFIALRGGSPKDSLAMILECVKDYS